MPDQCEHARAAQIEAIIPPAPADVIPLRVSFLTAVSEQWERYVPEVITTCPASFVQPELAKARFIAQMYARACYSMLLVSGTRPLSLALLIRTGAMLPLARSLVVRLVSTLLGNLGRLLPRNLHRRLLLTSAVMGVLDIALDNAAVNGQDAARRVASLLALPAPASLFRLEEVIVSLVAAARQDETKWHKAYWDQVLLPAVYNYCEAEVLAVQSIPDPQKMGHRWAGIDAAIKGMWYAIGHVLGLEDDLSRFHQSQWNHEQRWMADTSLLMQMIDDWVDQEKDRPVRLTPVIVGDWTLKSVAGLYDNTIRDLLTLLAANGIHSPTFRAVITDLYGDYLYAAIDAMRSGLAA